MRLNELISRVDRHKEEIQSFCQELVKTRSPPGKEKEIAQLILSKIRELGYDDFWVDKAGNVVGKIAGMKRSEGSSRTVVFNGHMDHVDSGNEQNWNYSPFSGVIKNGKLWGRGAADMKGPLGSMIFALGLLKRSCGVVCSTIRPSSIKMISSAADRVKPISWETQTIVMPSLARSSITSRTSLIISGSRALVGSSKSMIFGFIASALAIATRCCCPPDS